MIDPLRRTRRDVECLGVHRVLTQVFRFDGLERARPHVEIDRRDDTTSDVEVAARKNAVEWDKDYAESVLNSIIKRT